MATYHHLKMTAGDDQTFDISVTDAGAVDLTGASVTWILRRAPGSPAILTKTVGSGITIQDGPGGIFRLTLDEADTEALSGLYYHEAEVQESDGVTSTAVKGDFVIEPDEA